MASTVNSSNKICASCTFWGGSRKTDTYGQSITFDSDSTRGRCYSKNGGYRNTDMPARGVCDKWKKWEALR